MGVLVRTLVTETKDGLVSYVTQETADRIKADGFTVVHPLVHFKIHVNPLTRGFLSVVTPEDVMALFVKP